MGQTSTPSAGLTRESSCAQAMTSAKCTSSHTRAHSSGLQATSTVDTAATSPTWTSSVKTATLSPRVGKTQASCSGESFSPHGNPRTQTRVPLGHCDFCFVYRLLTNLRKTVPLPVTLVGEPVRVTPDKRLCVRFCYIGQDRMHVG